MTGQELDRFRRIEAIFDAAVEYPPGAERDAFLKEECAPIRRCWRSSPNCLKTMSECARPRLQPAESLPQFGAWRAIRLLGRGGMGTVYLAERADGAFRMSAAVKVVPLALASRRYRRALPARAAVSREPGSSESRAADRWRRHRFGSSLSGDGVRRRAYHRAILRGAQARCASANRPDAAGAGGAESTSTAAE